MNVDTAVTIDSPATSSQPRARLIAFYLPQFHPIAENDRWWGRGFTEWTNVAQAMPLFRGHYQPHVPADLGFYDLRVPETRIAQAELAASYGIEGFCYWHYWSEGKRLLGRPFEEVLTSGEPSFSFCLAWVNESWTRSWMGWEREVLQAQHYSRADDARHAQWLLAAFSDARYTKISGRPLFLVYRPKDLPDPRRTTDTIRSACIKYGLPEPYLVGINAWCSRTDCRTLGFDATLDYEPMLGELADYRVDRPTASKLLRNMALGVVNAQLKIYDYSAARRLMVRRRTKFDFPFIPSILVAWDNTPRRGKRGIILVNSTPERFESGLANLVEDVATKPLEERLIFLTAWNEWAEGNHLEPDVRDGFGRLEAVRRVVIPVGSEGQGVLA